MKIYRRAIAVLVSTLSLTASAYAADYTTQQTNGAVLQDGDTVTTVGTSALAANGGTITASGTISITTSGNSAYGAYATGAASQISLNNANITTTGAAGSGVFSYNGAAITSAGHLSIRLATGAGLLAQLASTSISAGSADVTLLGGNNLYALQARDNASVNITGNFKALTLSTSGFGVVASGGSSVTLGSAQVTTGSTGSAALLSQNAASTITIHTAANLLTSGSNSHGIWNYLGGNVTISGAATIATGVLINKDPLSPNFGLPVDGAGNVVVNPADYVSSMPSPASHGVYSANGITTIEGNAAIYTLGNASHGLYTASSASKIFLNGATTVSTRGDASIGALIQGSLGEIQLAAGSSITTYGAGSHGFQVLANGSKVFDGTAGKVLPTFSIHGAGSAALSASGSGSTMTVGGSSALAMSMTPGANTWGAKADNGGAIIFQGSSNSGGTGL